MKRIYKIFSVALMALGAVGCQIEEMELQKEQMELNGDLVTVTAGLPSSNGTKVSHEMDVANNLIKTAWEKGDKFYYSSGSSGKEFVQTGEISEDGKFANFTTTWSMGANKTYLFNYPNYYRNSSNGNLRIQNLDGTLEKAMECDYLYAVAKTDANKVLENLEFKRLSAFLQIKDLDFGTGVDGTVKTIYITCHTFGNRAMFNMSSGENFGTPNVYRDATIVIVPTEYHIVDGKPEKVEPLYAAFMPITVHTQSEKTTSEGDECTLTFMMENGDVYVKTWKTSSAYTAGNMYSVSGEVEKPMTFNIQFEEDIIRRKLIYYGYDTNGDEQISNIEASVMSTLGWVFSGDTTITKFNEFQYFTGITYMDANNSGTSGAFYGCSGLKEITLPASLTVIGSDSFNGCSSLETFTIPETVKRINAGAFKNCTNLKNITIPDSVTYMGEGSTFSGCTSLKSVKWPKGTTNIPASTFYNSGIEEFVINDNVTSIDMSAFAECKSLRSITIPASVEKIGNKAFYGCTGISSFEIPSGVTSIGSEAFFGTGAKSFSIPATVTSIGAKAFNQNVNITSFTVESGSPYSVSDDVSMLIKGTEAVMFFGNKTSLTFPSNVTSIAKNFAQGSPELISVTIPAVTKLGDRAFADCPKLTTAIYAADATLTGFYTFQNCVALTNVTLPEAATMLDQGLFFGCSSLKGVKLPSGIAKIQNDVFNGCSSLESIELPANLTEIFPNLFKGCASLKSISIPATVTKINNYAFSGCSSLTEIVLPATLTDIPTGMLENCKGIKSINLPESIKTIGVNAFKGTGLTSFTFPPQVTVLSAGLFTDCKDLKSLTIPETIKTVNPAFTGSGIETLVIPEGVKSLAMSMFQNCDKLISVTLPSTVTELPMWAFQNCTSLKTVVMPKVNKINMSAFSGCSSLESITIPEGVTELPNTVFEKCTSLKEVKFPSTLTKFKTWVFDGCTALKSITIPANVTSYGSGVWNGCTALEEVIIQNPTPCTINTSVFPLTTNEELVIYVPDASLDAYKAHASWSAEEFKGRIYAVSTRQ